MVDRILRGSIYWVADSAVRFHPVEEYRQNHPGRPFLVISSDTYNGDGGYPVVFGFPLSTSTSRKVDGQDVKLAAADTFMGKKCWVRIGQAQQLAKGELGDLRGNLSESLIEDVEAAFLDFLGIYL